MRLFLTINTLWKSFLHLCFPPDETDRIADTATFDTVAQKMRPHTLTSPNGTICLFMFDDPQIRALIHALKYRRRTDIADIFGQCLAEYLLSDTTEGSTVLVPVPLHPNKERSRGFNQSALIARAASKYLGDTIPTKVYLKRVRDTESQTKQKNKSARIENMRGAFSVIHKAPLVDTHIILIDDVATTGTTLAEAKRALRDTGVRTITTLVIASKQ